MKILIAQPLARPVEPEHMFCLVSTLQALSKAGYEHEWIYTNATPISAARDVLANTFLYLEDYSDFDVLVQLDDDHTWRPAHLINAMELMGEGDGFPQHPLVEVLGVSYVTRAPQQSMQQGFVSPKIRSKEPIKSFRFKGQTYAALNAGDYVGGGILMVTRGALEEMAETAALAPAKEADGQQLKRFFRTVNDDGTEIGEDVYFCYAWQKLGGTVYCNISAPVGHLGKAQYTADFETWARYNGIRIET